MTSAFTYYHLSISLIVVLFVSSGTHAAVTEVHPQPKAPAHQAQAHPPHPQDPAEALPLAADGCNGVYISYELVTRRKEYPKVKNATAQSWAFNATAKVLNTGTEVVKSWKLYIGFQHREILVSANGGYLFEGDEFPAPVGNGTYIVGSDLTDLETAIDTAQDLQQIQAVVTLVGTQFGVKPPGIPMPKSIRLVNNGYKCPQPTLKKNSMYACCERDPKYKSSQSTKKYLPRQKGDLSISYDVLQVYPNNYVVQVTMENGNPLGRLDRWNLTWEWTKGEFISTMKGAFTREIDCSDCIYGPAGKYYTDMDFSKVMNCQKNPVISDMPPEKSDDNDMGKIPFCCRNGTILPALMDSSQSKSVFTMNVFKVPPNLNKTSIYPPEKWKVSGILNPHYKCGKPLKVSPSRFPDPRGIDATVVAIASWQIVCNITRPAKRTTRCCVSFSAFYNESVVPCDTCACGCPTTEHCDSDARSMLLPPEALLVPFENRTLKAVAWAKLKHHRVPKKLPCGDNCGVSINWHIASDFKGGWSARITLFNWEPFNFQNWFTALQFKKASLGFEKVYSFNGTFLPRLNRTIFMQGLVGMSYLLAENNETNPKVPGKQQSVISFTKKHTPGIQISKGDGFPSKVFFNGEECSIPVQFPVRSGTRPSVRVNLVHQMLVFVLAFTIYQILY